MHILSKSRFYTFPVSLDLMGYGNKLHDYF